MIYCLSLPLDSTSAKSKKDNLKGIKGKESTLQLKVILEIDIYAALSSSHITI